MQLYIYVGVPGLSWTTNQALRFVQESLQITGNTLQSMSFSIGKSFLFTDQILVFADVQLVQHPASTNPLVNVIR